MSRFVVLTYPTNLTGFHLAGVEAYGAEDVVAAQDLIATWLDEGETGLLAVDEALLAGMDPAFIRRLDEAENLPYLAIPSSVPSGAQISRRFHIEEMLRRTIGVRITFKGESPEGER